jgi:hypothetical protein
MPHGQTGLAATKHDGSDVFNHEMLSFLNASLD